MKSIVWIFGCVLIGWQAKAYEPRYEGGNRIGPISYGNTQSIVIDGQTWEFTASQSSAYSAASLGLTLYSDARPYLDTYEYRLGWKRTGYFIGDLVIPAFLGEHPVTGIGVDAFAENTELTSVVVPDGVRSISTNAFYKCTALTNLIIGTGMTTISAGVFNYCPMLANIAFLGDIPTGIIPSGLLNCATNVRYRKKFAENYSEIVPKELFAGYVMLEDEEWLNIPDQVFSHYASAEWTGDYDVSHDAEGAMRSGAIGNNGESWIETTVNGPVRVSFWWKASSEEYDGEVFDYAYLSLDGEPQGTLTDYQLQGVAIGGKTGWTNVVFDITESGEHTVRWTYKKDEVDESDVGEDCVWLDEVSLDPLATVSFSLGGGEGTPPTPIRAFTRTEIVLPTTAGFDKVKHTFVGWNDGTETYGAGAEYVVTNASVTFTAIWRANTLSAPVIASADVADGGILQGGAATVSITAEAGAKIRYTLDGTVPTAASVSYDGPFTLDGLSVQIRAIAVRDNYFDSPVAGFSFTRTPNDLADCLNASGMSVTTDVATAWTSVTGAAAHDGVAALRSGAIGDGESSAVTMTVIGSGEISFWWKSSSEISRNRKYDYVSFLVDGEERSWLGGDKDWTNEVFSVTGDGTHTLQWVYQKNDNSMTQGEDCAWLDEVTWTPTDPLPEITGASEIKAVLAKAGDEVRLRANLTTVTEYGAFRAWADQNSLDHQGVKDSVHAWAAFALGANRLFVSEPRITISDLSVNDGTSNMLTVRKFSVKVGVNDDDGIAAVDAEKMAAMFEATTDLTDWTGNAKIIPYISDITQDQQGIMSFVVTPDGMPQSFFLRVKVK